MSAARLHRALEDADDRCLAFIDENSTITTVRHNIGRNSKLLSILVCDNNGDIWNKRSYVLYVAILKNNSYFKLIYTTITWPSKLQDTIGQNRKFISILMHDNNADIHSKSGYELYIAILKNNCYFKIIYTTATWARKLPGFIARTVQSTDDRSSRFW